ncbi:hypothetical protein C8R47DRAFT_1206555 [Mycena vitilis]|nr:hypothetical protein C8R47DRAFT_1206555 [Mycena vitilis]
MDPPSYNGTGADQTFDDDYSHGDTVLPAYTWRPTPPPSDHTPKEFRYEIKSRGNSSPWAVLTVQGDSVLSKVGMPTIKQGSSLVGVVHLDLRSSETIQAVCILIKGEVADTGASGWVVGFFEAKHALWTAAESSGKAKLKGEHDFPFSIEPKIPTTAPGKDGKPFRLPHSFTSSLSIRYTAELRIVRGMLRPDDKVVCTFAYFSTQQPGPPSALRRLAYQENSPLLGPDADPVGWSAHPISVKGRIFASRELEATCTFSLATPLAYTRSASIPCAMTIETADLQALDILSAPTASIVVLERTTRDKRNDFWREIPETCGQAVFWPSTEGRASTDTEAPQSRRQLMGEIHLRANLQPSTVIPGILTVEYSVVVFPFQAAGFKPLENVPLLRQAVEIATRHASGPRQRTCTPPVYETRNAIVDQYYRVNFLTSGIRGNIADAEKQPSANVFAFYTTGSGISRISESFGSEIAGLLKILELNVRDDPSTGIAESVMVRVTNVEVTEGYVQCVWYYDSRRLRSLFARSVRRYYIALPVFN